ncbi:hypothetical protein [Sphingobium sp. RAC03]|uniref:hypothetical protein n=1 Tax=Sphingobium sp. RAC03 TaxID=1843368 RepID=UPI00083CC14E|nr:hypothetical protein [Sphingobium sp. RAC03]AOF97217.1 hypothetical protein BSY17_2663 [Sphingobium sp. RAC03]
MTGAGETKARRSPQQRQRDERLVLLLKALERAADAGAECPSNEDLGRTLGYSGPSKVSDLIALLEVAGLITCARGRSSRVITIVKTGRSTAGEVKFSRRKGGWTVDMDAILMDAIAEGLTFHAAGDILRKSKNSCISRFRTLSATLGHQAA